MEQSGPDMNAAIWQSPEIIRNWAAEAERQEPKRAAQRRLMALLLPFGPQEAFTFLDLGAGTGAASRAIIAHHPGAVAILADFSAEMMRAGERDMQSFAGRYRYVEFDMLAGKWPEAIPAVLDAVVTSMCVHHLPDERKQGLFTEIFARLAPGGWYLNYDPVRADDPVVEAAWQRANDLDDPQAAGRRLHRTPEEQARWENHVRYIIPLDQQLGYLRSAGFQGIDVYWKQLDMDEVVRYLDGSRRLLAGLVARHLPRVRYRPPDGTYLAWLDCAALDLPGSPGELVTDRAHVTVVDGPAFGAGGAGAFRLNFATPQPIMIEMVARIAAVLDPAGE